MSGHEPNAPHLIEGLRRAGLELEETARLEGMDQYSPFGRMIVAMRSSLDAYAAVSQLAVDQVERNTALAHNSVQAITDLVVNAQKIIDAVTVRAELRLKEDEQKHLDLYNASVAAMVNRIEAEVAPAVLDKIKERAPFVERGFYQYARNRFIARLVLIGAGVLAVGFLSGTGYFWRSIEIGNQCRDRSNISYADTGKAWCRVPEYDRLPASPASGS